MSPVFQSKEHNVSDAPAVAGTTESGPDLLRLEHGGRLIALLLRGTFSRPGIQFFTSNEFSQQLAHMAHPVGKLIDPHVHNPVAREVMFTQEVLMIKRGRIRIDLYAADREYLESWVAGAGDVILLASGGHGFEVLEELEMIEVKQGPYAGDGDKTRFTPVSAATIRITADAAS
jgi:mannose-6-phosphate isomerase-like protein (cupin superfamily)